MTDTPHVVSHLKAPYNIYELFLVEDHPLHLDYDYYDSFVIVAKSSRNARLLASKWPHVDYVGVCVNEAFLDPKQSKCIKIGVTTGKAVPEVVCASFNAG